MSRLTREDFAEMQRCNERPGFSIAFKDVEREKIGGHIEAFLESGGFIQQIAIGVSGDHSAERRAIEASKGGKKYAAATSGTLGITEAARYLNVSRTLLTRRIEMQEGPPLYMVGKRRRFLQDELKVWAVKQGFNAEVAA